jgi:hypothetical protein
MAEKTLVDSQVIDSQRLLRALDVSGMMPELVVWYYYDDIDDWRLILCGKNIDGYLPAKEALAYKAVAEQLTKLNCGLSVSDIKFLPTKAPLISALRFIIGTGSLDISSIYMSNTTINGVFLKDVVVLRSALRA